MPTHPLTNFQIKSYYQIESAVKQTQQGFNGVYLRDNLAETKNGTYLVNLDEYHSVETHWIALYVNVNNMTYSDSFGVENNRNRQQKHYNKYL